MTGVAVTREAVTGEAVTRVAVTGVARASLARLPSRLFDGIVPATVATCSADGVPNVAVLSQVYRVDDRHVALSRQFFNKTTRNVLENPAVLVSLWDPVDFTIYRIRARFLASQTDGPLFDEMAVRIEAIASHTGMKGIFKLQAADLFVVDDVVEVTSHLTPPEPEATCEGEELDSADQLARPPEAREELWALQRLSHQLACATELDELLDGVLDRLAVDFGFAHSMVLLWDEGERSLFTVASHGYDDDGVGSEVALGDGLVGTVAAERRVLRVGQLERALRYGLAARAGEEAEGRKSFAPPVPLPGLPDAQSQLALPLQVGQRLVGVLAFESRSGSCFESWHEAFLGVVADQVAAGIDRLAEAEHAPCPRGLPVRRFVFYRNDDCVFVDGEYLIRNVPGRILWKLLTELRGSGRTEFTNRELRLDPTLGLPPVKDNLESRLILLRKRLEQKCPDVRLVRRARGRFGVELDCDLSLEERLDASG